MQSDETGSVTSKTSRSSMRSLGSKIMSAFRGKKKEKRVSDPIVASTKFYEDNTSDSESEDNNDAPVRSINDLIKTPSSNKQYPTTTSKVPAKALTPVQEVSRVEKQEVNALDIDPIAPVDFGQSIVYDQGDIEIEDGYIAGDLVDGKYCDGDSKDRHDGNDVDDDINMDDEEEEGGELDLAQKIDLIMKNSSQFTSPAVTTSRKKIIRKNSSSGGSDSRVIGTPRSGTSSPSPNKSNKSGKSASRSSSRTYGNSASGNDARISGSLSTSASPLTSPNYGNIDASSSPAGHSSLPTPTKSDLANDAKSDRHKSET